MKKRILSEEHKRKISNSLKGKNTWIKGSKASEETKAKMSATHKLIGNKPPVRWFAYQPFIKTWKIVRPAVPNKEARPLTLEEQRDLYRLGSLRIWGLKKSLYNMREEGK